jgi:hypothetical protein
LSLKYGKIRLSDDIGVAFNFTEGDRKQSDLITAFTVKHIQKTMVDQYGLKQVWIPDEPNIA